MRQSGHADKYFPPESSGPYLRDHSHFPVIWRQTSRARCTGSGSLCNRSAGACPLTCSLCLSDETCKRGSVLVVFLGLK